MAGGLSLNMRARALNWSCQLSATQPATDYAISMHTGDPGDDAASAASTEPTIGTGAYARAVLTAANLTAAAQTGTAGTPRVVQNTALIQFAVSTGSGYSTGATNLTWFALWFGASRATTVLLADMHSRGQLSAGQAVNSAGVILEFAAGALQINIDDT